MKKEPIYDEFLEKRKARQRKAKKKKMIISFVFLCIALAVTAVILCLTVFFPVSYITADGSKIYTQEEIIKYSGIKVGDNIFTFNEDAAVSSLKKELPFIEKVEFKRSLPDTLHIRVSDAKAYYCYKSGDSYFNVSKAGWVLERVSEKDAEVFEIKLSGAECKVGQKIIFKDEKQSTALNNLITLLEENSVKINSVDVTNIIALTAEVDDRFEVNFGTENDLENKVKQLKTMCESIEKEQSGSINLSVWNSQKPHGYFVENSTK